MPCRDRQTRQEIVNVSEIPCYDLRCLLRSPAMRSDAGIAEETKGRSSLAFGWLKDLL